MFARIHKHTHRETCTHSLKAGTFYFHERTKNFNLTTGKRTTYTKTYTNIHTHTRARARIHTRPQRINILLQKRAEKKYTALAHIHRCSLAPCPHIYTYSLARIHTHTHTHTHTQTHTCTRTYTHDTSMMSRHSHVSMIIPNQHICVYGYVCDTNAHARDITLLMSSRLCQHDDITLM